CPLSRAGLSHFYFHHPTPAETYTLSLHDALPISMIGHTSSTLDPSSTRTRRSTSVTSQSLPWAKSVEPFWLRASKKAPPGAFRLISWTLRPGQGAESFGWHCPASRRPPPWASSPPSLSKTCTRRSEASLAKRTCPLLSARTPGAAAVPGPSWSRIV